MDAVAPPHALDCDWPDGMPPFAHNDLDIQADPYAHYTWLLENAPVLQTTLDGDDIYFVSRFADVEAAFRNHRVFSSQLIDPDVFPWMTLMDPPRHGRVRQTAARAFTPKALRIVEAGARANATRLYDRFAAQGGGDVIEEVALPLTLTTICGLVGLPTDDLDQLQQWSSDVGNYFGRIARRAVGSATDEAGTGELLVFLRNALETAADAETETVAGNIGRMWKSGELTEAEATSNSALLLLAGHETTSVLIGNGFINLSEDPTLLGRLHAEPEAIVRFVEETVRHRPSAQRLTRLTVADVEIAGCRIPKGSDVRLLNGAANRDPAKFERPEIFDLDRDTRGHLGFGSGIHTCLGAFLARLEGRIMFEAVAERTGGVELSGETPVLPFTGGGMSSVGPRYVNVNITAY